MRILITGSRFLTPKGHRFVWRILNGIEAEVRLHWPVTEKITIVQGLCPYGGVDLAAAQWGRSSGADVEDHPAEVDASGRLLGPARNSHMVALGADVCLAFPGAGSRGTWDCLRKAVDAGIPARVYPLGDLGGKR